MTNNTAKYAPLCRLPPRSHINPIRNGTIYATVFDYFYGKRTDGVSRHHAIEAIFQALQRKHPKRLIGDAVSVITSPTEDGTFHRSARNVADVCWFEKENGWIRMKIRKNDQPKEK